MKYNIKPKASALTQDSGHLLYKPQCEIVLITKPTVLVLYTLYILYSVQNILSNDEETKRKG